MMSLLIVTEGGAGVGLGHIRRCLSLATALKRVGIDSLFRVAGGEAAEAVVARAGFAVAPLADPGDAGEVATVIKSSGAGAVVIDSYRATEGVFRASATTTIVIDDLADRVLPVELVVNPAPGAARLDYSRTRAALLLGPRYALLRPEFASAADRTIRASIERVMVTVGGGDHGALASNIVRWCIAAAPEAAIEVVVGPFSGHSDDLRAIAERTAQVVILEQPDMREAMLRADVGVSAGGQTLFELAVTGLPAIVIAMAANQKQNVADFAAAGTIRSAGEHDMPRLASRFAAAFEEVRSAEVRRDMSRRGLNLVDGRGAERTASSIAMLLRDSRSAIG